MGIVRNISNALGGKKAGKNLLPAATELTRRTAEIPVEVRPARVPVRYELSEALAARLQYLQDAQATALQNITANANAQIAQIQNATNQAAAQVRLETRLRFSERVFDFLTAENIPLDAPLSVDGHQLIVMVSPEEATIKE